jgi:hypothetical protein
MDAIPADVDAVYHPRVIKRDRRSRARLELLDQQIIDVLAEDHPQSIRHVFYRMTNPRLGEPVEKSERGYQHIKARMKALRRNGRVPYDWVSDSTRTGYITRTFDGAADFLQAVKSLYRADLWKAADFYCEVWVESRSIAGIVLGDCRSLAVNLYPAGGFTSISLAYQAATYINEAHGGRDVVILYIGDYDPAGVLIDVSIERELREHLSRDVALTFKRLGITLEQISRLDLPTKPRKTTDRRALHITETVEAEAMPAAIMRQLLRSEIEALLPPNALAVARAAEQSERDFLGRFADAIGGPRR